MSRTNKNVVLLTGTLGANAEKKDFGKSRIIKLNLCTVEEYGGTKKTTWHNLICWNELADKHETLEKGDFIEVEGKLNYNAYTNKEGVKQHRTEIICLTIKKI